MKNYELYRSLHARGETTSSLAAKILSSHGHVSMTLNNTPGRGALTRRKLARLLTAEELKCVGWDSTGNIVPAPGGAATFSGKETTNQNQ